jgi:hypothetical protein
VRKLAAVVSTSVLGAALILAAVAAATVSPIGVTARVTPPHNLKKPFTYTIHGVVVPPKFICPPGSTNPAYCTQTVPGTACKGNVQITVSLGVDKNLADSDKRIGQFTTPVKVSCNYSLTRTIQYKILTAKKRQAGKKRYVHVKFNARFLGNTVLSPKSAPQQIVIAKLINPSKKH